MLPGRQLSPHAVLFLLRRWRWLLIAPTLLGMIGGLLYSRWAPSLYRSDALIQIVPQRVPESYVNATVTERVEDRLRAIGQQVLSRTQLEKLITDFSLFPEERASKPLEDVVELMRTRISIAPVVERNASARRNESEAFRVSFDYEDAGTTQKVVEKLASFFIDTNARERGTQADQTSAFLEAQMNDARTRLEQQEQRLKTFRERNAGSLPTQTQANMQAIQNAQMSLQAMVESLARDTDRKLILERLYNESTAEAQAPQDGAVAPDPASGALPVDATPARRLEAARQTLAQMELRLSDKHPDITRMRRAIEELEKQVETASLQRPVSPDGAIADRPVSPEEARRRDKLREQRAEIESLNRQIAFKTTEEQRMRALVASYQSRLEAVPGVESEWVALTRDYDTLQATYRDLLAKSESSKMAASLEQRQIGEQFRILDSPRVPERPFSPNRGRINAMATAGGLAVGLGLVALMFLRDSTMRSESDVIGAIDIPVLVTVPYVTSAEDIASRRRGRLVEVFAGATTLAAIAGLAWVLQLWRYVL
ncbi:MAG: hypothetical protein IT182_14500 [Acidobacteria bacterium]|nr:hypothetical protein [Acidobacteriota bacterium]